MINIFLRDATYSVYLCDHYALGLAEQHFELPLDSVTAGCLLAEVPNALPAWCGVKHVDQAYNEQFQREALRVAKSLGTARVHLDAYWWSVSRDASSV